VWPGFAVAIALAWCAAERSARIAAASDPGVRAWTAGVAEGRLRLAQRPEDPVLRLRLASGLLELAAAKCNALSPTRLVDPGDARRAAETAERQAAFAGARETQEAEAILRELVDPPAPAPVRLRARELLAMSAARSGDADRRLHWLGRAAEP
jgi:hypothetical protein